MEELAFARKYRPLSWSENVGNEEVKEKVMRTLATDKPRPQIYLFTGNSGCGKTTSGRLIIKEYLCEDRDPVKGACCKCPSCLGVDEYIIKGTTDMLPDVKEIDLTNEGNKSNITGLIEEMQTPSYTDNWKVYLLDECHEASNSAQNSLLKIIEEPPEKVLVIFCTTDPQKMLLTLRTRCQMKFNITKPKVEDICKLLAEVCMKEDVGFDMKGINMIARKSEFTPRTALNDLESIIRTYGDAVYDNVLKNYKELQESVYFDFYKKLLSKDTIGYMTVLSKIKQKTTMQEFCNSLLKFTMRGIYVLNGVEVEGLTEQDIESYSKLFKRFTINQITFMLKKLLELDNNSRDVEGELMLLAYTGMGTNTESVADKTVEVQAPENELMVENKGMSQNVMDTQRELQEVCEHNAESYSDIMGIEDMLSMFDAKGVI